jgi:hypothetical protein
MMAVPSSYKFVPSAIDGGGFQNVIAVSPFPDPQRNFPYLLGADVAGLHRSLNKGKSWDYVDGGTMGSGIGAILWSNVTPGKVWVVSDDGLHVSTNFGETWSQLQSSGVIDCDANNKNSPTAEHPRQTGNLIAQHTSGAPGYLWVGTHKYGLKRSTDGGLTFPKTVLDGLQIRGVATNPLTPTKVYAVVNRSTPTSKNGVYEISNATGTPTAKPLPDYPGTLASPVGPEEIHCVVQAGVAQVFVAGHVSGIFRYTPSTDAWTKMNAGLVIDGTSVYNEITSDPSNPQILYCGCWKPKDEQAIFRSTNGGANWSCITGPDWVAAPATGPIVVDWKIFGTQIRWWAADIDYHRFANRVGWLASDIAIDPEVPNRVLTAGRGGCWFGTLSGTTRTWQPAVHGLMATVNMAIAINDLPGVNAEQVMIGNMDYISIFTPDAGATVRQIAPLKDAAGASTGDVVCWDMASAPTSTTQAAVFVGASKRGQQTGVGAVWRCDNPEVARPGTWVPETGSAFNTDVMALAVGRNASDQRVILAITSNTPGASDGGLWMKVGTGAWTKRRSGVPGELDELSTTSDNRNMSSLRFRRNGTYVYALATGSLWRSADAGVTWVKLLPDLPSKFGTYNALELDPVDVHVCYVSANKVLKRIDNVRNAASGADLTVTTLWGSGGEAGNVAIQADGSQMVLNIRNGQIMRTTNHLRATSQAGCSWADIANNLARAKTGNIRSIGITPAGFILTAENGSGSLRGIPRNPDQG